MPVEGFRERHDTCRFGTYQADETEGLVVAGCAHPVVSGRYNERFCAHECPAYKSRPRNLPKGHIPLVEDAEELVFRRP